MGKSSYPVGYRQPPTHSQFQKGQSGNPGGKPRPRMNLRLYFEGILSEALVTSLETLRKAKPDTALEAVAFQLAIHAAEGRPASQRLVVAILNHDDLEAVLHERETEVRGEAARSSANASAAQPGHRDSNFRTRCEAVIASGDTKAFLKLAAERDPRRNSLTEGLSEGNFANPSQEDEKTRGSAGISADASPG